MVHKIIQTEDIPCVCTNWLKEQCQLYVCPPDSSEFMELLSFVDAMVIRTYTQVNREIISAAPKLKVIGRAGVGVDNIDLQACKENGVRVVNTPDANTESVVDFILSRMLMKLRKVNLIEGPTSQREWDNLRDSCRNELQFSETTLGIVGFGRIGSRLGRLAKYLGFRVLYHDIVNASDHCGCEQTSLEELLKSSNVVSINVDGRKENRTMCNSGFFKMMRPDCLFINSSRGLIVDSNSLAKYLTTNELAMAILDVHDPEPIIQEYPLLNLPNAELYPHIACKTNTAAVNMGWVVKDVISVLNNNVPQHEISL